VTSGGSNFNYFPDNQLTNFCVCIVDLLMYCCIVLLVPVQENHCTAEFFSISTFVKNRFLPMHLMVTELYSRFGGMQQQHAKAKPFMTFVQANLNRFSDRDQNRFRQTE